MSILSRMFGKGASRAEPEPSESYEGFTITPEPIPEGGQHRIAARIEKDGRAHHMIRADLVADRKDAVEGAARKARALIDEQGERIFG